MILAWDKLTPSQRERIAICAGFSPQRSKSYSHKPWSFFGGQTMDRLMRAPWWAAIHNRPEIPPAELW